MANRITHDQLIKDLILDYPRDALTFFAPDDALLLEDKVQITPIRHDQLQQNLGSRYPELVVALRVDWIDGRREATLFAMEVITEQRRLLPHQLARYCLVLAKLNNTNRVVPVIIFLGEADSAPTSLTVGSKDHNYLTFDYLSCKLKDIPFERWQHSDNLVARINLPNMRYQAGQKLEVCSQAYDSLLALEQDRDKRLKYLQFIDFYAGLNDNELDQMQQKYLKEKPDMAGFAQHFRQEGRQEGERKVLERQLQHRFGILTPEISERLSEASSTDLEKWAENVLDAEKLEDVFGSSH